MPLIFPITMLSIVPFIYNPTPAAVSLGCEVVLDEPLFIMLVLPDEPGRLSPDIGCDVPYALEVGLVGVCDGEPPIGAGDGKACAAEILVRSPA